MGRPASNDNFSKGELDQRFEIWREGRPLQIERLWLKGNDLSLDAEWGLHGFPVVGNMICITDKKGLLDSMRNLAHISIEQELFSVTQVDDIILCYFLGNSVEKARNYFIDVWKIFRQEVIQLEAVEPRIWKT